MKRTIILAIVFVMLLVSLGGCFVGWEDGWGRRGRGHGEGHDRGGEHDERR
ncbi:hypothetical protein [Desulfobacterium sp. N47]|uniref:Lipoprotein n=1 Tax=uncultured Desulfobacterium sp. TaxID=201089 RepID=E1YH29_9BACT|nr:unknown protein [uncultured Desulfobacterium sp.]